MQWYRADLHIHSVLSPCGDLEMSPERIVEEAIRKDLDVIAITDHNSTRQAPEVMAVGREKGLLVLCGAEVNTREEVHGVALFENEDQVAHFQQYLDAHLPDIPNKPDFFGHQVWVNRKEEIMGEEPRLLWSALDQSLDEVAEQVRQLKGLFFPAHIDRPVNGLLRQLGFVPEHLQADALEVCQYNHAWDDKNPDLLKLFSIICNSDAHTLEQIGQRYTMLWMEALNFSEILLALRGQKGRKAKPIVR
jgi:predicted metal-dependent phosphoesterase TrpH